MFSSIFGKKSEIVIDNGWFQSSFYGGICLNVRKIIEDNIRYFDVDMKVEYLKNLLITNTTYNISGDIILVSNFGVVDGQAQFLKESGFVKKQIRLYEFKDVYHYFFDKGDTPDRLVKIYKLNLHKFQPVIADFK